MGRHGTSIYETKQYYSQCTVGDIMDKTIFVLLDACRFDTATRYLGHLEHLIDYEKGAKYKILGELPSLSRPMYGSIFTGLATWQHGITCNERAMKLECDSVFSLCKKAGGSTAAVAWSWLSEMFNRCPFEAERDRVQLQYLKNVCKETDFSAESCYIDNGLFYWDDAYPDAHVFAEGEWLRNNFSPDFLLYHTMAIDNMGHLKGGESAEYAKAVSGAGHLIANLLPQWLLDGYQVVISADHGMDGFGIHVGSDEAQRMVPLYIFSDKVKAGRYEDKSISQLCVAPLMCRLLGIGPSKEMMDVSEIVWMD